MATIILEIYGALCETKNFSVNGIEAESRDFGDKEDMAPYDTEDYCCGDMRFTRKPATDEVLHKYNITHQEYNAIAEQLEEGLSFGSCGWCS